MFFTRSPAAAQTGWTLFEETSIRGTVSGAVRRGHIFRTLSGRIYEVIGSVYEYVYEYSPSVLVLKSGSSYRLVIEGFDDPMLARCLNCDGRTTEGDLPPSLDTPDANVPRALTLLGVAGAGDLRTAEGIAQALGRFQAASQLSPTGLADPPTRRALALAIADRHSDNSEALLLAVALMEPSSSAAVPDATSDVIESTIVSDFDGLEMGNVYRLANGQVWEQTEAWIWIWIWVNPSVLIWRDGSLYKMKVENIDHPVMVRRIR